MEPYVAPVSDYRFLLSEVLGFENAMADLGRTDIDIDLAVSVLEEAGRLCAQSLHPLNRIGDEEGCQLANGQVTTPTGFAAAYRGFAESGWTSLSADSRYGGQGLPFVLQLWFDEMLSASNLAFGLVPGLSRGAADAIAAHGDDALKSVYLPKLVNGEWTGAMALTEGGAGTDLSLLKTKAVRQSDGSYAVTGQKIFISTGDHDFGGNVIHLVLARLPDAPDGIKGISLFLVPKFLVEVDGSLGTRNGMSVGSLEKKMGIHAQPTCTINYDGATGFLVGEPNRGLPAMFTMMNAERLMVGMQGLGIAGAAYAQAVGYAKQRLQGRSADGTRSAVPIIEHADVRRMLLNIRSFVEAGRALAGWTALEMERAHHHADPVEREKASALVSLLTPVVKAGFTDFGFESAVQAQQVFGGHGYIREWGMEQYVRDARIAQIYEGTNGVQAMDLVGRKLSLGGGAVARGFFDRIAADLAVAAVGDGTALIVERTGEALNLLRNVTDGLRDADTNGLGSAAVDTLRLFALVCCGWMWARIAAAASDRENPMHAAKRDVARYFAARVLPQVHGLAAQIKAGPDPVMALVADAF